MAHSKFGPRVLGFCAVLVCALSLAGAAQAEPNAFWLVNGTKISNALLPPLETEADTAPGFSFPFGTTLDIHIKCKTVNAVAAHLVEPLAQLLGKLLYKGCTVGMLLLATGIEDSLNKCLPSHSIETSLLTGLVKLHEGKGSLEVNPSEAGKPFATLLMGEECVFGTLTFKGTLSLKDAEDAFLTDLVKHLMTELDELSTLKLGTSIEVTLDGSFWLFLSGAHKNFTFAAHPA
jgi:hypothetical protein